MYKNCVIKNELILFINLVVFNNCNSFVSITFPNATQLFSDAFGACHNLVSVSFPEVTTLYGGVFQYCSSLQTVYLPKANMISAAVFSYCSSLSELSLPNATYIGYNAFFSNRLTDLYLLGSSVCSIHSSTGLSRTYIHVPESLYDIYISSQYWSSIASWIVSVPSS